MIFGIPARPSRRIGRRKPSSRGPSLGSGRVLWPGKAWLRLCCFPARLLSRKPARDSQKVDGKHSTTIPRSLKRRRKKEGI